MSAERINHDRTLTGHRGEFQALCSWCVLQLVRGRWQAVGTVSIRRCPSEASRSSRRLATFLRDRIGLRPPPPGAILRGMYVVTEADIREVYERDGELSAAVELRRRFPGITDDAIARNHARWIAGWAATPEQPIVRLPKGKAVP